MSLCSIYKGFIIIERISHKMVCFKLYSFLEETYQIMIVIILYNKCLQQNMLMFILRELKITNEQNVMIISHIICHIRLQTQN